MNTNDDLMIILGEACEKLHLELSIQQKEQLIFYAKEFNLWNKTYNLSSVRTEEGVLKRHIIDTLSIVTNIKQINANYLADIGTGGGLPGVVLAIVFPELNIFLVESIGKKCRFLRHIIQALGVSEKVTIINGRVEKWNPANQCNIDIIICRAFSNLKNFVDITSHLANKSSIWLAMKAANTKQEESFIEGCDFSIIKNIELKVPFEDAKRYLIYIRKQE